MIIVTGGALVFQGWRLDPLLLLCQLMTCAVATAFALETISLRSNRRPAEAIPDPPKLNDREPDETFFYDFDPYPPESASELPLPRKSVRETFGRTSNDQGWTVQDDDEVWFNDEDPQNDLDPSPSKPSGDRGSYQIVEDWD